MTKSKIKNIIFDFGGVLVDWNPHYLFDKYFNDIEEANYFVENVCNSEWNAEMDGGKPFEQAVRERTAMFPKYAEALKLYQTNWMDTMGEEIPGMYDLIKSLKENGFPVIYGLTNWSAETFPTVQKTYRIFSLIDKIVVSGEVKQLKPNPEIFHTLLNKYNLKAEESLFIDDNLKNVEGAKAVGINAIRFENANKLKEDLESLIPSFRLK